MSSILPRARPLLSFLLVPLPPFLSCSDLVLVPFYLTVAFYFLVALCTNIPMEMLGIFTFRGKVDFRTKQVLVEKYKQPGNSKMYRTRGSSKTRSKRYHEVKRCQAVKRCQEVKTLPWGKTRPRGQNAATR